MSEMTVFTRIVAGELPSYTVYEDEVTYAFLDANPVAPGHTLLIPKSPYKQLQAIPRELAMELFATLWELIPAIEAAIDADATTIALNNGAAAEQDIPHLHWHIVPRFEDDGTLIEYHSMVDGELPEAEMRSIAAAIRDEQETA